MSSTLGLYRWASATLCLLLCLGCLKEDAELRLPLVDDRPVVYCLLHPDSVITAQVFRAKAPLDTLVRYYDAVTIELYRDDVLIDTLQSGKPGFYRSKGAIKPAPQEEFQLVIKIGGIDRPIMTDKQVVPEASQLDSIVVLDSATIDVEVVNLPVIRAYPKDDMPGYHLFGLSSLFQLVTPVRTHDLFVVEAHKCQPGINAFDFGNLIGKDFSCVSGEYIELGWFFSDLLPEVGNYSFQWGTMSPAAIDFFESWGPETSLDEAALFLQPTAIKSNIEGAFGVFGAYNTTNYAFIF